MGETSVKLLEAHTHTKNLLDLVNEFSDIAEYKINIQKSVVFRYTYNEQSDNEIDKNSIYTSIKENEIFRNKFNRRNVKLVH